MICSRKLRMAVKAASARPRRRCGFAFSGQQLSSVGRFTGGSSFSHGMQLNVRSLASTAFLNNDDETDVPIIQAVSLTTEDSLQSTFEFGNLLSDIPTRIEAILEFHEEIGNPSIRKQWNNSYERLKQTRNRTIRSSSATELRSESDGDELLFVEDDATSPNKQVDGERGSNLSSLVKIDSLFADGAIGEGVEVRDDMNIQVDEIDRYVSTTWADELGAALSRNESEQDSGVTAEENNQIDEAVDVGNEAKTEFDESDSIFPNSTPNELDWSLNHNTEKRASAAPLGTSPLEVSMAVLLLRMLQSEDWREFDSDDSVADEETSMDSVTNQWETNLNIASNLEDESNASKEDPLNLEMEERLGSAVEQVLYGASQIDTEAFNVVLANLALSGGLSKDEIHVAILQIYRQMESNGTSCCENRLTVELVLRSLAHRLDASSTAISIVEDLNISDSFKWSHGTLHAAISVCTEKGNIELALEVVNRARECGVRIPARIWRSLMELAKNKRDPTNGIYILECALKENKSTRNPSLDKLVCSAAHWPHQNRKGMFEDNSSILSDILTKIANDQLYIPGMSVWRALAKALSKSPFVGSRPHLIRKLFYGLSRKNPKYWPGPTLLRCGLQACEALSDSKLAAELIRRMANHEYNQLSSQFGSEAPQSTSTSVPRRNTSSITFQDIVNAMSICVRANDIESARTVLYSTAALGDRVPSTILAQLFELCIKCSAKTGHTEEAEYMVQQMMSKSLSINDEVFGAIIRGYASAGNHTKVKELFSMLETHANSALPGQSSYNSYIFSCLKSKDWDSVLVAFDEMKNKRIRLNRSACHGVLVASHQLAGKDQTLSFLEHLLKMDAELSSQTFLYLFQMVSPMHGSEIMNIQDIRLGLRHIVENDPWLEDVAMDMMRALRSAEKEECRTEAESSKIPDFQERKASLWRDVHRFLLRYAYLVE